MQDRARSERVRQAELPQTHRPKRTDAQTGVWGFPLQGWGGGSLLSSPCCVPIGPRRRPFRGQLPRLPHAPRALFFLKNPARLSRRQREAPPAVRYRGRCIHRGGLLKAGFADARRCSQRGIRRSSAAQTWHDIRWAPHARTTQPLAAKSRKRLAGRGLVRAEGVGFEPTRAFARRFSRPVH